MEFLVNPVENVSPYMQATCFCICNGLCIVDNCQFNSCVGDICSPVCSSYCNPNCSGAAYCGSPRIVPNFASGGGEYF